MSDSSTLFSTVPELPSARVTSFGAMVPVLQDRSTVLLVTTAPVVPFSVKPAPRPSTRLVVRVTRCAPGSDSTAYCGEPSKVVRETVTSDDAPSTLIAAEGRPW